MTPGEFKPLIEKYAAKHGLKPGLVYAVVKKESGFDHYAMRFEAHYKWLFKPSEVRPRNCSLATEETLQRMSFGLMQCMGGLLRELGFRGWLGEILGNAEAQLDYGCLYLARQIKKYGELRGLSAYNAGSPTGTNAEYVNTVMAYSREWSSIEAIPETDAHADAHKRIDALFAALREIAG